MIERDPGRPSGAQEAVMTGAGARGGRASIGRRTLGILAVAALAGTLGAGVIAAPGRGAALDVPAPAISGGPWINSAPLTPDALRGRVVFVEFWTYG
jgi:hypothetical protein